MQICVATDLSAASQAAVNLAITWAKPHQGHVQLLHVVHDPELAPALSGDVPGDLQRATEALSEIAANASVPCTVDVRAADNVADGIVAAAKQADYLFVGSQGKSALQRMRLGSIATAVLRRSQVPIVCCPHSVQDGST